MHEIKELKYGNTRCYLINNTVLVDTDMAGTLQDFFACIKKEAIHFQDIRYLICTHFHPDHMGIAQDLADHGIQMVIMEEQKGFTHFSDVIFARDKRVPFTPIKDHDAIWMKCSESRKFLKGLGVSGEIIHTPGHSDDSISLIIDNECALVGDMPPLHSVPAYNNPVLEKSWNKILSNHIGRIFYAHPNSEEISGIHSIADL